jgi:hypothetical protein
LGERGRRVSFCPICESEYETGITECPDCNASLVERLPAKDSGVDPDATLVEVYETSGDSEAFVIKGLLESDGIWCSLESDVPHSVFPLEVDGLGAVRIMVSEEDAERASTLIASYREEHGD